MRLDLLSSYLAVRIDHVAACPEISPPLCAELNIPDHEHHQRIDWLRLAPGASVSLGRGWQASLQLPVDVRVLGIEYTTLDGDAYKPPYGDIHHRDEVLRGLTDGRAMVWRYTSVADRVLIGLGAGSTLPLGRTESDPFTRGARGLEHQHAQLGTGTFAPLFSVSGILFGPRWGGWLALDARTPLYANQKGYEPPLSLGASLGPTFRVIPDLQLMVTIDGLYETPERWNSVPHGGREGLTGSAAAIYTVSPRTVLQASGRAAIAQRALDADDEEPLRQGLIVSAGVSWTVGRSAADDPDALP